MKKSIKTNFIILSLVLISIPILTLGFISYKITSRSLQNIIELSIEHSLIKASKTINDELCSFNKYIELLSYDEKISQSALNMDESNKQNSFNYIKKLHQNNKKDLESILVIDSKGKVVFTSDNLNPNLDLRNSEYVKQALNGIPSKSDVILSKVSKKPVIAIAYPLKLNGSNTGAIVGIINFESISKYASEIKIGKKGYAYMFEKNGTLICHPNKKKILKENILETNNKNLKALISKVHNSNNVEGYYTDNSKKFVRFVHADTWILGITADYNEYMGPANNIRRITIFLSMFFILISVIIAYKLINKSIINPIFHLKNLMKEAEDGNLTVKANISTKNEIEDLANSFNRMIDGQRNLIKHILNSCENLTCSSEELTASSQDIDFSVLEITKNINKVSDDMLKQHQSINETSKILIKLSNFINLSKESTNIAKENSDKTITITNEGRSMINDTVNAMVSIHNSANDTSNVLCKLQNLSKEVEGITGTINDISNQTNLLALNAAIEAARAGENGKGFSIVAEEIRTLSEESNEGSNKISTLIKQMVSEINSAVNAMAINKDAIEQGVIIVNETDQSFINITNSIKDITKDINKIASLTEEEVLISNNIITLIEEVSSISENTSASSQEISASCEEQSSAIESLSNSSQDTSSMALDLNTIVEKFKL